MFLDFERKLEWGKARSALDHADGGLRTESERTGQLGLRQPRFLPVFGEVHSARVHMMWTRNQAASTTSVGTTTIKPRPHNVVMSEKPEPDWYLQDWVRLRGKKQAHLTSELGWLKNAAYRIWHGKQPYRRDILNQVAAWLEVQPYELLMPPPEAMAIRRLRESAAAIVSGTTVISGDPERFLPTSPTPRPRAMTGTRKA
ncbi:hypothetical protein [Caulobacter sp. 1776]|uniref:hypothetical protein n=1 Tax=Caulobacter sp. 1776 TaxID=3156420 RepID=UPI003391A6D4